MIKYWAILCLATLTIATGCGNSDDRSEQIQETEHEEQRGEHDRDGREHQDQRDAEHARSQREHEESGMEYRLSETCDEVRNGARLVLRYDSRTNSFVGSVGNVTDEILEGVRVEVHTSDGKELGPTVPRDLKPGEKIEVKLTANSTDFTRWSAHPEVGNEEHK